uniref:Uncharacterized protein n=1 Tax=Vespula pensylvanica TaxID=30213 RepID=A0A834JFC2_VESPE|nr:hypothetical protein H0235_018305 [Vespula pensylvanica]
MNSEGEKRGGIETKRGELEIVVQKRESPPASAASAKPGKEIHPRDSPSLFFPSPLPNHPVEPTTNTSRPPPPLFHPHPPLPPPPLCSRIAYLEALYSRTYGVNPPIPNTDPHSRVVLSKTQLERRRDRALSSCGCNMFTKLCPLIKRENLKVLAGLFEGVVLTNRLLLVGSYRWWLLLFLLSKSRRQRALSDSCSHHRKNKTQVALSGHDLDRGT